MIVGMAFAHNKAHVLANEQYQELEKKLLIFGGRQLVYMPASSSLLRLIIDQGQVFDASKRLKVKGEPSHCHDNVIALWQRYKGKYRMVHGYGLSDDGLWRQHSWLLDTRGTIIETTLERVAYYGVILEGELARLFAE